MPTSPATKAFLATLSPEERAPLMAPFDQPYDAVLAHYAEHCQHIPEAVRLDIAADICLSGTGPAQTATAIPSYVPYGIPTKTQAPTAFQLQRQGEALRRHCLAVMYVLGASWHDLGILFERSREAMRAAGRKGLSEGKSTGNRYVGTDPNAKLRFEHMSHYMNAYRDNMETLLRLPVDDAAAWLHENVMLEDLTTP